MAAAINNVAKWETFSNEEIKEVLKSDHTSLENVIIECQSLSSQPLINKLITRSKNSNLTAADPFIQLIHHITILKNAAFSEKMSHLLTALSVWEGDEHDSPEEAKAMESMELHHAALVAIQLFEGLKKLFEMLFQKLNMPAS